MKKIILYFISLLALITNACKTQKISAPKPPNVPVVIPSKPTSIIGLPIYINVAGLAASVNKKFPLEVYKDDKFDDNGNDNLKLIVLKRSDFSVNTANNGLSISAPLHIDFVYNIKVFGGFEKPISQSLNLTVVFNTSPAIDRNWNLNLNSKGKILWDDLPIINLGLTTLDLPKLFGAIIQSQVNKMAAKIDQEVPKNVDIKKIVSESWKTLEEPFLIDSAHKAWLLLNPKNIFITPITYTTDEMQIKLGVSSIVEVIAGYKPKNDSFNINLPPLRQVSNFSDDLKINLSAAIAFEQINETLNKQFANKPMVLEGNEYKININEAKAFPYGNKIMIAIDLDGKVQKGKLGKNIKGIVYATGVPVYNATNKSIEIKQFDFDLKTRDVLVKSASWLVNSKKFRENMEKQMVFSIANQLNQAIKTSNEAINKQWSTDIDISGIIKTIEPANIYVLPKSVNINIITQGNLKVVMKGF
jgi:hypothetical protein